MLQTSAHALFLCQEAQLQEGSQRAAWMQTGRAQRVMQRAGEGHPSRPARHACPGRAQGCPCETRRRAGLQHGAVHGVQRAAARVADARHRIRQRGQEPAQKVWELKHSRVSDPPSCAGWAINPGVNQESASALPCRTLLLGLCRSALTSLSGTAGSARRSSRCACCGWARPAGRAACACCPQARWRRTAAAALLHLPSRRGSASRRRRCAAPALARQQHRCVCYLGLRHA